MTKIVKGYWDTNADASAMNMTMPLYKVDKENRLVSGFATLDNLDTQGDVVDAEASVRAFSRAKGNIREQHDKFKAVGKMVDFREDEIYDKETNKFYRGVYVTAYVSKGAEDTWQKVLDGTLSGFSIGGSIKDYSNEISKDSGSAYRLIKEYDLTELSLVDSPANQLANVISITKSADGSVKVAGMVAETKIENVFYCANDGEAQSKPEDSATCLECGSEMENIGWFETVEDRLGKVSAIVNDFVKSKSDTDEGGVTMAKNENKVEEVVEPVEETDEVAEEQDQVSEVAEEATDGEVDKVDEVSDDEDNLIKMIDELKVAVHENLEGSREETRKSVEALENKIDELNKVFTDKASEIEEKLDGFVDKLETHKSKIAEFEKSLELINASSAFRKSSDVESEQKTVKKSKWNGAFSVDSLH